MTDLGSRHHQRAPVAVLLVLLLAGGALVVPSVAAQDAVPVEVVDAAWWSRRPGAGEQPPGGFEVASAVAQDLSVAALRVRVPPGWMLTTARVVLTEESAAGGDIAQLQVCAGPATWEAANPGAYSDAPEPDCDSAVDLERQSAGGRWVGDVAFLLAGSEETTLMILPGGAEADSLPTAGFQLVFSGAEVVATGQETGAAGGDGVVDWRTGGDDLSGDPAPGPGPSGPATGGGFTPPPAPDPGPGATDDGFAGPPDDADVADDGDDVAAAPTPSDQVGLGAGPVAAQRTTERPWHRLLLLVPLSALAGGAVVLGRTRLREGPPALLRRLTP